MKIVWLTRARQDLRRIQDYIANDNPKAARKVLAVIRAHVSQLRDNPKQAPAGRKRGTRELVNHRYPHYIVVYKIDNKRILILRVLRDSQLWTQDKGKQ